MAPFFKKAHQPIGLCWYHWMPSTLEGAEIHLVYNEHICLIMKFFDYEFAFPTCGAAASSTI